MKFKFAQELLDHSIALVFEGIAPTGITTYFSITRPGHSFSQLASTGWKTDLQRLPCSIDLLNDSYQLILPLGLEKFLVPGNYVIKIYGEDSFEAQSVTTLSWDGRRGIRKAQSPFVTSPEKVAPGELSEGITGEASTSSSDEAWNNSPWRVWGDSANQDLTAITNGTKENTPATAGHQNGPEISIDAVRPSPARVITCPKCHKQTFFTFKCNVCGNSLRN